jgi:2-keto-4-pentenoate hydratase/2-oxohepta-3-ene-1,7-dioic acid hydratase in catechol pathway
MLVVSYWSGSEVRAGASEGGRLVDASDVGDYPASVRAMLAAGRFDAFVADARRALAAGRNAVALESVRLAPPIPDPDKIICLGLNYRDHAAEAAMTLPSAPILFPKFRNSLVGAHDDIVVPRVATQALDYEAELAVVIDTFAPMGPGIVPAAEIGDPQTLMLTTRVNGTVLQHASTKEMIFAVAPTIEFITSFMTLEPGDIIATGTPAGVGFARKPPIRLHAGDVVEVEIEKIGTLRNVVVFRGA